MSKLLPDLDQQQGGITVHEFAERNHITFSQAIYAVKHGKVIGARKDSRSKKWRIFPPALLVTTPRNSQRSAISGQGVEQQSEFQAPGAARSSRAGDMAEALSGHAVAHPTEAEFHASAPLTKGQQAKRAAAPVNVYRNPDTLCACRGLVVAARRNRKKGIHYLRLAVGDCWQVYFALRDYRDRLRRAIGKGKADHAELRATDNLWNTLKRDLATSTGAFWL